MLKFFKPLLRFLPSLDSAWISPKIKPFLAKLPTIFAILDQLVMLGYTNGQWSESKAREAIKETVIAVSDGTLSASEIAAIVEIVIRKYDLTKAANAVSKRNEPTKLTDEVFNVYSKLTRKLFK